MGLCGENLPCMCLNCTPEKVLVLALLKDMYCLRACIGQLMLAGAAYILDLHFFSSCSVIPVGGNFEGTLCNCAALLMECFSKGDMFSVCCGCVCMSAHVCLACFIFPSCR